MEAEYCAPGWARTSSQTLAPAGESPAAYARSVRRRESSFRLHRECQCNHNQATLRVGGGSRVSESVISVSELTRRFGATTALDSVSVSLARGAVYGLVGANGAGKTTLIRHILGLLRAESGSVRLFRLDPVADPVAVLSRVGYLSEENDVPGWMRIDELIRYSRAFYPAWDDVYAEELRQTFGLDPTAKIKDLSKGQKSRVGLLIALAYRPDGRLRAVSLRAGDVRTLINQDDGARGWDRVKGEGFSLQITTDQNIDEIAKRIKDHGGNLETEPADMPWGARVFRLRDPDGFKLAISSPRNTDRP